MYDGVGLLVVVLVDMVNLAWDYIKLHVDMCGVEGKRQTL